MDGLGTGRAALLCTLLLWAFQICSAGVSVKVYPEVEVIKGQTARLPCSYSGSQSSSTIVEWFIEEQGSRTRVAFRPESGEGGSDNGTPLSGRVTIGKNFTLTVTSIKPSDELTFICQVTAGPDGSGEASTMLKVFYAPESPQLTKSSTQAISVGQSFPSEIGSCISKNGHPPPRIIWFKNDVPLPEIKDKKEKTYMVPSVVKESSGLITIKSILYMLPTKADKDSRFHCTVEYKLPEQQIKQMTSNVIKLDLNYPSEKAMFSIQSSVPIKEGDDVIMKCETDGNPQPTEFEFKKNDKDIVGTVNLLKLKSVNRSDSGEYMCHPLDFENLDADLKASLHLDVNYIDPMNVTPKEPQVVMLDGKVAWQCKTKASKSHTVQWKKGSEVLSQDGTLSIEPVTYDKAGEYVCVGAVPTVPGLSAVARVNLTVKGKPVIEPASAGEVMKEGDTVTLKCTAYGHPAPQFTWTPSGKQSVTVEGNKVVSTVTLEATNDVMQKGVTCEVANEYGKDSMPFPVALKRDAGGSAEVLLSGNPVLKSAESQQGGSSAVVIAVVVCVLLLLLLVALIFFLSKKSKLPCGKKDKKEVDKTEVNNDIVVEMKSAKTTEQSELLIKNTSKEQ
nr:basal cell adhesion molecule isoform X1 [Nothobranchius furzeri]